MKTDRKKTGSENSHEELSLDIVVNPRQFCYDWREFEGA